MSKRIRRATHCANRICGKPLVGMRVWSFDFHARPMFSPEYCSRECFLSSTPTGAAEEEQEKP